MMKSNSFRSVRLSLFVITILLSFISIIIFIVTIQTVDAFIITPQLPITLLVVSTSSSSTTTRTRTRTNSVTTRLRTNNKQRYQSSQKQQQSQCQLQIRLQMCICINCSRVTNCAAYHFVETKHNQPHMIIEPTFTPQDGSPTIHVNVRTPDRSLATTRSITKNDNNKNTDSYYYVPVMPETTIEYDVVACQDYIQDIGCWIRNMPDEIRIANPDFVPT